MCISYADIASMMSSKNSKDNKRFEVSLDQLLLRNYTKDVVFNHKLCTKEQLNAYMNYMTTYGGGCWLNTIQKHKIPYYSTGTKIIGDMSEDRWQTMQDMIKDSVAPRVYNNYKDFAGGFIIIPYQCTKREFMVTNTDSSFCYTINAMQSYYNRFKYVDKVQRKIDEIISSIRDAIEDVMSDDLKYYDIEYINWLYRNVSINYCAYSMDMDGINYVPDECFAGCIVLNDRSQSISNFVYVYGKLTTGRVKFLIRQAKLDYDSTMCGFSGEDKADHASMEFRLYGNCNGYGYCVRVNTESKRLMSIILREFVERYNEDTEN